MNELYNGIAASLMSKSAGAWSETAARLGAIGTSGFSGALIGGATGALAGGVSSRISDDPNTDTLKDILYGALIGAELGGIGGGYLGNRAYSKIHSIFS